MKKYIGLFIAAVMTFTFCAIGCDTEEGGSSSSGGGSGSGKTSITGFTVTPSGTIEMTVDETKDFTIAYQPANATFNPADLTYDMDTSYLQVVPELIKFSSGSISITVKAIKAGTTTVNASLISNPKIKGSITFDIKGADSSENGGEDITVSITTLHVNINVSDLTIDDIIGAELYWGLGNYSQRKTFDNPQDPIKVGKNKFTINKTDAYTAVIEFSVENKDFTDDFGVLAPYFYIRFVNMSNGGAGNMEEVYQETGPYEEATYHSITVDINTIYGDAAIELN